MKSVSDLNAFVRTHMLEPFDALAWVDRLVLHFEDLTRAHAAVVRARDQLARLGPLLAECEAHDRVTARMAELEADRDALPYFVADATRRLLEAYDLGCRERLGTHEAELSAVERALHELREREQGLVVEQAGYGGDRLGEIERQLRTDAEERDRRRARFDRYTELVRVAGLAEPADAAQFAVLRDHAATAADVAEGERAEHQNRLTEVAVREAELKAESTELNAELVSLRGRRSNLPRRVLELRERLAGELGLTVADLPFAGELIRVRDDAADWEGAAERVLHGFALSMLVRTEHYPAVSDWIDANHLGLRLVYYRVPATVAVSTPTSPPAPGAGVPAEPLHDKLQIKEDSPFYAWVERELWRRADHHCAAGTADFRRCERAVTRAGQVRSGNRHEKNDDRPIGDRSGYVLGWSPEAKIDALLTQAQRVHRRLAAIGTERSQALGALDAVTNRCNVLVRLLDVDAWDELDWATVVARITRLEVTKREIEKASRDLERVTRELAQVRGEIAGAAQEQARLTATLGALRNDLDRCRERLASASEVLSEPAATAAATRFDGLAAQVAKIAPADRLGSPEAYLRWQAEATRRINEDLTRRAEQQRLLGGRVASLMHRFRTEYPAETTDMDASVASAHEYRALHDRLEQDDLPRFEAEFKTYLNTNTIRDVAGFQSALARELDLIRERIDRINESLLVIDYNPGRYIRLETQLTPSVEIRDFRADLRACTDNALAGDDADLYSERRFLQVQRLVERFRGRPGQVDADQAWTRRVTDVRNWFVFVASERRREDDSEHETYADTSGKSGGQKEKLAYTVLAASLAYQFKLDWGVATSRTFRFVVIDEAFGRGSDESTRYALNLFRTLGLQLLIVTPLQKIHVIEPYVAAVGFVDNRTGSSSRIQTLTIEEFRERQAQFVGARARVLQVE
jgi:uncharacterized protein YPO0396